MPIMKGVDARMAYVISQYEFTVTASLIALPRTSNMKQYGNKNQLNMTRYFLDLKPLISLRKIGNESTDNIAENIRAAIVLRNTRSYQEYISSPLYCFVRKYTASV